MPATADFAPRLPPELCLKILRSATSLPSDFDLQLWRNQLSKKSAKKILRRRVVAARSLARVCRAWWEFATPFLYETLWITRVQQLELLFATLSASHIALASHVERLVLALIIPWDSDPTPTIVSLLRLLPNLRSLHLLTLLRYRPTNTVGRIIALGVSAEFMRALPKTLEVLNLTDNPPTITRNRRMGGLTNSEEVCTILNGLPSLHTYACSSQSIFMIDMHKVPHLKRILMPFFDSLFGDDPSRSAVANITEVVYHCVLYGHEIDTPDRLIRRFGHALTRVTFSYPWDIYIDQDLSIFADFFPNLIQLDLHIPSFTYLLQPDHKTSKSIQLPPTVAHLGLRSQLVVTQDDQYAALLHCCRTVTGAGLETVQLTSQHNCGYLKARRSEMLASIAKALSERNIGLLDWEGTMVDGHAKGR